MNKKHKKKAISQGYLRRIVGAVAGRFIAPNVGSTQYVNTKLEARIASLELELHERDHCIGVMRGEYEMLKMARDQMASRVTKNEMEILFKKIINPLANLSALASLASKGKDVALFSGLAYKIHQK